MDTVPDNHPAPPGDSEHGGEQVGSHGNGHANGNGQTGGNGHARAGMRSPLSGGADPWDLLTPTGFLAAIFRQKWKIFTVFASVVTVAAVILYYAPPVYQSNAKLLSRIGRESLAMDPTVNGPTLPVSQSRESEINTELAILQSRYLLEQVVDRIGAQRILNAKSAQAPMAAPPTATDATPVGGTSLPSLVVAFSPPVPAREKAIEKLARNIEIEVEGKSNIIDVSLNAFGPEVAHEALQELIRLYLDRHIEIYSSPAQTRFFRDQTERLAGVLRQKEEDLARFRQSQNLIAPDRQKEIQLTNIASLQRELIDASSQISASAAKIAVLTRSMNGSEGKIELSRTTGKTNYAADNLKNRLAELRQKESDYASRYASDSRFIENLREQIRVAERQLTGEQQTLTEVVTGVDTTWQALQLALETEKAQAKAQSARRETLLAEVAHAQRELDSLASQELPLIRQQRELSVAESEYNQSRETLRRSEDAAALDLNRISSINIVQPATLPIKPVKPRKLLLLALSAFLALCAGMALALVLEAENNTLRCAGDVRDRLGLPVLASLSSREFAACERSRPGRSALLAHKEPS